MVRPLLTLIGALVCLPLFHCYSQVAVSSIADGDWTTQSTWDCGCVPDFNNAVIRINPGHDVTISTTVFADQIIVSADASLTIATGGRLELQDGAGDELTQEAFDNDLGTFANGQVHIANGGVLDNAGLIASIPSAMTFAGGSEYRHNQNVGVIVGATWQNGSTCRITGWGGTANPNSEFVSSLSQDFHHFIWDSPSQSAAIVILGGGLTTVNGNLTINDTNTNSETNPNRSVTLGFNTNSSGSTTVLGDLIVVGESKLTFSTSGTYTMNIGGNVILSSTAPNGSVPNHYIINSSSGTTSINITGDLILNSGQLNFSQGTGTGNVSIGGDFQLNGGSINKPSSATANITFTGAATHDLTVGTGTFSANQAINYIVEANGTLNLLDDASFGGNLTVNSGATLHLLANLSVGRNILFDATSTITANDYSLTLNGSVASQTLSGGGKTLHNLIVNKSSESPPPSVDLTGDLSITGRLSVSAETTFISNGNLHLVSTSDGDSGNASIGPLLDGASVTGDVIVDRYMSSEGSIYRYISSSITNAAVSQLQDDFPVTGAFPERTICPSCGTNPSLFYYDAVQAEYVAYPVATNAEQLAPGRGYSVFIPQNLLPGPLTIDLTGPINQGSISLPLSHNTNVAQSWNLVGNPYPSSVDWDNSGWTKTNINGQVAVRDNGGGGIFRYWNGSTGNLPDGIIAAGQAFWVQTMGSSPVLTIHEDCKTETTGTFYRETEVNAIAIKLSRGSFWDQTYFQIHTKATQGFDYYDAPKLVNDNFDFSTRFNNSTAPLAINAVDEIQCDKELFLDLRFTKASNGSFRLHPEGTYVMEFEMLGTKFSDYNITLTDKFSDERTEVTSGASYSFTITADKNSLASDRFKLTFEAKTLPNLNLEIDGSELVCNDREISLVIHESEPSVDYYLVKDDTVLTTPQKGNGEEVIFVISGSLLKVGNNEINIGAKKICKTLLSPSWNVLKDSTIIPDVVSGKHCREGQVELSVNSNAPRETYYWYDEATSATPVFVGKIYTTPHLLKSKSYFVSTVHDEGCESERGEVTARIVQYDDAEITILDGDLLSSNYETGNQWVLNDQELEGEVEKILNVEHSGMYRLVVTVDGCVTESEEYLITSIVDKEGLAIEVYPNPASTEIFVNTLDHINSISLISSTGQEVGVCSMVQSEWPQKRYLNVEHLTNGVYYLKISLKDKTLFKKIIKK